MGIDHVQPDPQAVVEPRIVVPQRPVGSRAVKGDVPLQILDLGDPQPRPHLLQWCIADRLLPSVEAVVQARLRPGELVATDDVAARGVLIPLLQPANRSGPLGPAHLQTSPPPKPCFGFLIAWACTRPSSVSTFSLNGGNRLRLLRFNRPDQGRGDSRTVSDR